MNESSIPTIKSMAYFSVTMTRDYSTTSTSSSYKVISIIAIILHNVTETVLIGLTMTSTQFFSSSKMNDKIFCSNAS